MFFARVLRSRALLCAVLLLLCALLAHPVAEIGGNDDFAYARSAKILAETGHIAYVGWSSAMLGWQLFLGAAFIKLFGFSFTITRVSMLCVAILTAALIQRTAVRLGLNEWNATLVTLTLVLSPLFLGLSVSFMSDIPGLLAIVAAVYCCARAIAESNPGRSTAWLAAGTVLSTILGTARQTGWLGALIVVPCTCWVLRRRRLSWTVIIAVWIAAVLTIFGCMHWFSQQMYSTAENAPMYTSGNGHALDALVESLRLPLELAFFLGPILIGFTPQFFRRGRRTLYIGLGVTALLCAVFIFRLHGYWAYVLLVPPANREGNYVTPRGILELPMFGVRPVVLSPLFRLFASIVFYFSACSAIAVICSRRRISGYAPPEDNQLPWKHLLFVLGCLTVFYCGLLSVRILSGSLFDRYLLPLLFTVGILAARFYQDRIQPRLPAGCYALLVPVALFGVAGLHDMFAADRARLAAIQELESAAIPRTEMYGGFAFDGWTQIDNQGYIDADDIRTPTGIHHIPEERAHLNLCGNSVAGLPAIHPHWLVSYDQTSCGQAQDRFAPVPYNLWLPPRHGAFYIRTIDPQQIAHQVAQPHPRH